MEKISIKTIYWLLILLLALNLFQAVGKFYSPYYYNVFQLGALSVILTILGLKLQIKKLFVYIFGIISLALVTLLYLVVWN